MVFWKKALLTFIIITLVTYLGHLYFVNGQTTERIGFDFQKIYIYLVSLTSIMLIGLYFAIRYAQDKASYAFMASVLIKGGLAILIFPQLIDENAGLSKLQILNFLVPYFIFLGMEAYLLIKGLNQSELAN